MSIVVSPRQCWFKAWPHCRHHCVSPRSEFGSDEPFFNSHKLYWLFACWPEWDCSYWVILVRMGHSSCNEFLERLFSPQSLPILMVLHLSQKEITLQCLDLSTVAPTHSTGSLWPFWLVYFSSWWETALSWSWLYWVPQKDRLELIASYVGFQSKESKTAWTSHKGRRYSPLERLFVLLTVKPRKATLVRPSHPCF